MIKCLAAETMDSLLRQVVVAFNGLTVPAGNSFCYECGKALRECELWVVGCLWVTGHSTCLDASTRYPARLVDSLFSPSAVAATSGGKVCNRLERLRG